MNKASQVWDLGKNNKSLNNGRETIRMSLVAKHINKFTNI